MKTKLVPGRVYAGIKIPFLASTWVVASYLLKRGMTDVTVMSKAAAVRRYDGILPVKPPHKDWDTWVEATYDGGFDFGETVKWVIQKI
jgi:hypothetical protein